MASQIPIVHPRQFLTATRQSGYKNTSAAVAELIDNSIQARASTIDLLIQEHQKDGIGRPRIAILDNGVGMAADEMTEALRFGGSSRFDDRTGPGRFGMGLPNASMSQARKVDVYSWRDGGMPFYTCLDVDRFADGRQKGLPRPRRVPFPEWLTKPPQRSGTLVVWTRCDRVEYGNHNTLITSLRLTLGRVFRLSLAGGLRLRINGDKVYPIDPVRMQPSPSRAKVRAVPPMVFDFSHGQARRKDWSVTVQFTLLPVSEWAGLTVEEKRAFGISNGAGISILRAGREIAYGWFLVGSKRRENYDDWWRCEVSFEPCLDELFGVTNSKQGIRPTRELVSVVSADIERQARNLNRMVRQQFEALNMDRPPATAKAARSESYFPVAPPSRRTHSRHLDGSRGVNYRLNTEAFLSKPFVRSRVKGQSISVTLNANHPFYTHFYEPARTRLPARLVTALDALLLSLGRAEHGTSSKRERQVIAHFLEEWSDRLAAILEDR